ncbi:MAG TPA: hypothetical protein DEB31_03970 [Clostridiales bacterium]|nr:hypothetical protein [Clostridiales bacterium]
MIVVGEKLNSSTPEIRKMMDARDAEALKLLAANQTRAGAPYLDINTSTAENPYETMKWAITAALSACNCGISVDSPDERLIERVYGEIELKDSLINSVTLEQRKLSVLLPLAKRQGAGVVALPVMDGAPPKSVSERVAYARRLADTLLQGGIEPQKIFLDITVCAAGADKEAPTKALCALHELKALCPPGIHFIAGISNVSFGLPGRELLNRAYLAMAMGAGLSAAILDPLDGALMAQLMACELLLGRDEDCGAYIAWQRKNEFSV